MGQNVTIQARRLETDFKRSSVSWAAFAADLTILAFAGQAAIAAGIATTLIDVAGLARTGQGVYAVINEAFNFPNSCVYTAKLGCFGDVKDYTVYNGVFCRVYQIVKSARYTYGQSMSNGENTYVREPTTEPSDATTAINNALNLYNTCIATYGYNALYEPR